MLINKWLMLCYVLLCIQAVMKCKVAICWLQDKLLTWLKNKLQNLSDNGLELINVLPLPMEVWTGALVYTNCLKVSFLIVLIKILWMKLYIYRSFATRVSQLRIWHFWVTGIERNVYRCTFNRYSVLMQLTKLAAGEQLCRRRTHRKL
jgi:hypothetical protein